MKRIKVLFLWLFLTTLLFNLHAEHLHFSSSLPTYFTYSAQDQEQLRTFTSSIQFSEEQLFKWDTLLRDFFATSEISAYEKYRVYTYLYAAQRDGGFLSYNTHDFFAGSLDPLSLKIVRLFLPSFPSPSNFETDPYSIQLSNIVFAKFQNRFLEESGYQSENIPKEEPTSKYLPWIIRPLENFKPAPPPPPHDKSWEQQLSQLKRIKKQLTKKQKEAAECWEDPVEGNWLTIANRYMIKHEVALAKTLLVRSMLAIGLYDATVACEEAKYTYNIPRPHQYDEKFISFLPTPQSPSYPSCHSLRAETAASILCYYFCEECDYWKKRAEEEGHSRLWGGVHFPIDHTSGKKLGKTIGHQIIISEGESPDG